MCPVRSDGKPSLITLSVVGLINDTGFHQAKSCAEVFCFILLTLKIFSFKIDSYIAFNS